MSMRRLYLARILSWPAAGLLAALSAAGAEAPSDSEKPTALELKTVVEDPNDAAHVAHEIVRSFMSEDEYKACVKKLKEKFEAWREESHEDMERYLNDRLVGVALAAASGKQDRVKEGALFLSYYHAFNQPLPKVVTDFVRDNHDSLQKFFHTFTWESAGAYIHAKQWRKDAEARKSAAKTEETDLKSGEQDDRKDGGR